MPGTPYPPKARRQAVVRALEPHTSITRAARDVGCSASTMRRWLTRHRQEKAKPSPASHRQHRRKNAKTSPVTDKATAPNKAAFPQDKTTFVPVNIIDDRNHRVEMDGRSPRVEIVASNGMVIRLADASPRYIAELLNAIASC